MNSIIAGNNGVDVRVSANSTVTASYTLSTFKSWAGVNENVSYDSTAPLFADAANRDYTLAAGSNSQAIDQGDDSVVKDGDLDLAGNDRKVGTVDLGAYELQTSTSSVLDEAFAELFIEDLDF